jgi:hypothetical protein
MTECSISTIRKSGYRKLIISDTLESLILIRGANSDFEFLSFSRKDDVFATTLEHDKAKIILSPFKLKGLPPFNETLIVGAELLVIF